MQTTGNSIFTNSVPSLIQYLITGITAGVIGGVVNIILFVIGQSLGVPFEIAVPPLNELNPLNPQVVFMFSFVPGIGAAVLAWLLHRFVPRGKTIFLVIAILFLLLSFIPDITMVDSVTVGTKAGLILMHIVAGGIITYMLHRKAP